MVPVQFFQSVIAIELAIVGALLWQIRYFDKEDTQVETSRSVPRLQLLLLVVLTAILFGSLEALRVGGGQLAAVLLTVGLAVSLLPILLRVLRPVRRDATVQPRDPQLWVTLLGLILFAAVVVLLISSADHVRRRSVGWAQALTRSAAGLDTSSTNPSA